MSFIMLLSSHIITFLKHCLRLVLNYVDVAFKTLVSNVVLLIGVVFVYVYQGILSNVEYPVS